MRLTPVGTSFEVVDGTVRSAEWRFGGREGPLGYASTHIIESAPEEAFEVGKADPWERSGITGFGSTTVRWQRDGVDWTVEFYSPPVYAFSPRTSSFRWRSPWVYEWRVKRLFFGGECLRHAGGRSNPRAVSAWGAAARRAARCPRGTRAASRAPRRCARRSPDRTACGRARRRWRTAAGRARGAGAACSR